MSSFHTDLSGPLAGLRVVEFEGIRPGPCACMMLSDMGADVVGFRRTDRAGCDKTYVAGRGRTAVQADLESSVDHAAIMVLLKHADVLVEGCRPGVMDRLGIRSQDTERINPRLIDGRITGWGRRGPLADTAGHDLNYIANTGARHAIDPEKRPVPPLNILGDYAGGSVLLVIGILAALRGSDRSGRAQVVDAEITDVVINLMAAHWRRLHRRLEVESRSSNMLNGGHPYYDGYETADGRHLSLAAIEPKFWNMFCDLAGLSSEPRDPHSDRARWPQLREELPHLLKTESLEALSERFEGTDACVAPVIPTSLAREHPENIARQAFIEVEGMKLPAPAPAPRFSRTPAQVQRAAPYDVTRMPDVIARWRGRAEKTAGVANTFVAWASAQRNDRGGRTTGVF